MRWKALLLSAVPLFASRLSAASDVLIPSGPAVAGGIAANPSSGLGAYTLVVAVLCALAGGWLLWRGRNQSAGRAGRGKLCVSETRSLGNRQYLVVASYGEKKFLIGVCVGRISMLAPLDDGAHPPSP